MLLPALLAALATSQSTADLATYMSATFEVTEYESASADLNDDGTDEIVVWATSTERCGTGGCTLFVLVPTRDAFKVVMHATVVNPPVRALESRTKGWRDLAVTVTGGGELAPHEVRLRFDGSRYPSNPTVPPAERLGPGPARGDTLISDVVVIPMS